MECICCIDSFEECEVIRWVGGSCVYWEQCWSSSLTAGRKDVCSRSLAHPRRSSLSLSELPRDLGVSLSLCLERQDLWLSHLSSDRELKSPV